MGDGDTPGLDTTLDASASAGTGGALPAGALLGKCYQIGGCLGEGGMGVVYLARDEVLGCDVALKLVNAGGELARLRDEVLLAQKVTHENVCRTYDLEEVDGRWLVKMEYVAGVTLARRLKDGPLAVDEARRIARQIAAGLAAAHARGVVHRDLKPQNVMIEDRTGRVVLMDFGLARLASRAGAAAEGVAGTPEYMAPEQARGLEVDGRADLYALGCVLFHMLAGRVVFPAATPMAAVQRHLDDAPPDARTLRPDTPSWLAELAGRLLAKDPAARPQRAEEAIAALAGPAPRTRWPIAVAAAALALAVGLTAWRLHRPHAPWRPAFKDHLPFAEENADFPVISPDGRQIAFSSARGDGRWRAYVAPLLGGDARAVTPPADWLFAAWSPDGRSLLTIVRDRLTRTIRTERVPLDGGAPEPVTDGVAFPCGDGLLLPEDDEATCAGCAKLVRRDPSGAEQIVTRFSDGFFEDPSCDRAGRTITWLRNHHATDELEVGDVWVMPIGGEPRQLTTGERALTPVFTPVGKSVVYSLLGEDGSIDLWEQATSGGAPRRLTWGPGPFLSADVSPDGKTLICDQDLTGAPLEAIALDTGDARQITTTSGRRFERPHALADGQVIIERDDGADRWVESVAIADGSERRIGRGQLVTTLPDGQVAYMTDGGALVLTTAAGGAERPLAAPPGRITGLVGAADGLHATVENGSERAAWRIPVAGDAPAREADAPWCYVSPAPAGGWREFRTCDEAHAIVLAAPGEGPDGPHARVAPHLRSDTWAADGRSIVFYDGRALARFDVETGATTRLATAPSDAGELTLSPDGATAYLCPLVAHVKRELITNFGER